MAYFLGLVRKEIIEIAYSWKNLGFAALMLIAFLYLSTSSDMIIHNENNACYIITLLCGFATSGQLLTDTIFSDKRNQTLEINFAMKKLPVIMLSKNITMMLIGLIPFTMFFIYFLTQGYNLLYNTIVVVNTILYLWAGTCIVSIVTLISADEKATAFLSLPCICILTGLIYVNYLIEINYGKYASLPLPFVFSIAATVLCYKLYTKTRLFLKI